MAASLLCYTPNLISHTSFPPSKYLLKQKIAVSSSRPRLHPIRVSMYYITPPVFTGDKEKSLVGGGSGSRGDGGGGDDPFGEDDDDESPGSSNKILWWYGTLSVAIVAATQNDIILTKIKHIISRMKLWKNVDDST